jgi:hypothetical protein
MASPMSDPMTSRERPGTRILRRLAHPPHHLGLLERPQTPNRCRATDPKHPGDLAGAEMLGVTQGAEHLPCPLGQTRLQRAVGRSSFIAQTVRRALEDERRWDEIESALGACRRVATRGTQIPAGGSASSAVATTGGSGSREEVIVEHWPVGA